MSSFFSYTSIFSGQEIKRVIKKKRKDIPAEEKKICLWVLDDGTACGKTFTKFDSLKRHVSEAHKGVRPFSCTLCGKNYGRRDYLLRHLRSHNEAEVASISTTRLIGQNNQVVSTLVSIFLVRQENLSSALISSWQKAKCRQKMAVSRNYRLATIKFDPKLIYVHLAY